ncbi:hypothetical protein HED60_13595 [Planctomycetales bacterium ZRK34]|nr:hypothetical protein HED60_13595 [Planctomycetales bacterium ZRK34]
MERKWTHLIRAAQGESIGSVLVRLARAAADTHMTELHDSLHQLDADRRERTAASSRSAVEEVQR